MIPEEPNWEAARAETVQHLQRLIRLNTVNPPGNEIAVARYLNEALRAAGIETRLLEPAPSRAAIIARLAGTGAGAPVLLMAHMDVVGVEPERWSVEPFGAVIKDGYLYGRGAIDDKGMLAANLETMLLLKRHVLDRAGTLARDVIFLATSDEEAGGKWGVAWLFDHHPDLLRAEFALNEGGRVRVVDGQPLYVAVQTAEKVTCNITLTACGRAGHASVPLPDNAIFRLSRALARVGAYREPLRLNPTTRAFFRGLAAVWMDRTERRAMVDLTSRDAARVRQGERVLSRVPVFDSVLRNGISATMVGGGFKTNVIPAEASANLNVRVLPGQSGEGVARRLRRLIDDPGVRVEVKGGGAHPPSSPVRSPMFAAIAASVRELDPRLITVPFMSAGGTESAYLRAHGIQAYGVLPFPLEQADEDRMHGHDERVPLESLHFGTRLIYGTMARVAR